MDKMVKFRKFKPEYCDLPTMIENMDFLLRLVNVKINKNNDGQINIIVWTLWVLSLISYYYSYVFSMVWFVFVRCPQTGDLVAASVVFSLVVCSQPSFITMFHMIIYKKRVQKLIENCLQLNELVKPGTQFATNLHTYLRYIKKRASVVLVTMVCNGLLYITIPLIMPGRHLTEDQQIIYGLEPMLESPNFEIATVLTTLSVIICVYSLACITALNLVILGYIEAQMIALSKELWDLWKCAENYNKTHAISYRNKSSVEIRNTFITECLKEIICFHILNIKLVKEYETLFQVTKAIEFIFIILAIISELLGGIESTYLQIPFTFVLILMECIAGQKIMDACTVFEKAVYSCKWEKFDIRNRKIILFMLANAQKTLNITAGGMAKLNFSLMLSVFKFSYSTYNTLRLMVK